MTTAIVHVSRYGTTRECAEELAGRLPGEATVVDLRTNDRPDLGRYDTVVIGAPVYGGKLAGAVGAFCERHRTALLSRTVGLFICCLYEGEKADEELETGYPAWLSAHAAAADWFGGAVEVEKLGLVDRFLFRRLAGVRTDIDRVRHDRIAKFAAVLAAAAGS